MYDEKTYSEGSTWFDTEKRIFVELLYCRNVTDFRPLIPPKDVLSSGIYGVLYDDLPSRMIKYNIKSK